MPNERNTAELVGGDSLLEPSPDAVGLHRAIVADRFRRWMVNGTVCFN